MRATMEWHGVDHVDEFPPIKVIIADGADNEDVVIKVSDEGGGIPRSNMKKIWSYLFTTADPLVQKGMVGGGTDNISNNDHSVDSPLAGLGYGLPISRSYCRYFGGDLSIMSMEGYGTDAFVHLTRLGNRREPIPL
jgi:pyruvate dehydrogenase kinase 2/3/4